MAGGGGVGRVVSILVFCTLFPGVFFVFDSLS